MSGQGGDGQGSHGQGSHGQGSHGEGDPRRVLQVLGSSAGGVARHVAQVAAGGPWRTVVAGPADLSGQVAPHGSGVRYVPVEIRDRPGPADLRSVRRLAGLAHHADVLHAHGLRAGALAVLAARSLGGARPPVVVTLHNLPVGGRAVRAVARLLELVVARGADVVLGVSGDLVVRAGRAGARRAERALVPAPPRPEPVDPQGVRDRETAGGHLVVSVARLAPQKGLDVLCDAAALLRDADVRWLVAGDGPLEQHLASRVRQEGLPVRLLGRRDDVPDLLAAADVVVSTARWEGQPIALQEAVALGRAVVATDVGGTREVTGDAAVLVPDGDAGAVAAAVRRLLADDGARGRLEEASRARARELPTLLDTLDQLERLYRAVGGGPRTSGPEGDQEGDRGLPGG